MVTTAEFNVTAEVPTVAVTCATAPATLLGWNVVVAVPVESVVAVARAKP